MALYWRPSDTSARLFVQTRIADGVEPQQYCLPLHELKVARSRYCLIVYERDYDLDDALWARFNFSAYESKLPL